MMEIAKNLTAVQERIINSAIKAGRNAEDIKLIAVTKTIELLEIIEWHLIGNLQKNKAKY